MKLGWKAEGTLPQLPKPDNLNAHVWGGRERLWCELSKGPELWVQEGLGNVDGLLRMEPQQLFGEKQ